MIGYAYKTFANARNAYECSCKSYERRLIEKKTLHIPTSFCHLFASLQPDLRFAFVLFSTEIKIKHQLFKHFTNSTNALSPIKMLRKYFPFEFYAALTPRRICLRMNLRSPPRNDRKKFVGVRKHSWGVCKHPRVLAKITNMLLIFVRKAYSQHIREQSQAILIDGKTCVVTVRRL